ncbi:amino acid transporter [Thermocatellispora tengchongensis]|uniref:Amino acid transporter n=1 Tax=Thermocatellispora tengchongensis TaxID=1073253 RepID=A0A840P0V1_9ACTN|nr:APC family permease [Thermocatellispora tengchongensis]MBB5131563.1 amino acid transporter [Thermocatellispora tengchongensis]
MSTVESKSGQQPAAPEVQRLKSGAIGLFAVLFMAVANAAPITAMTGNVPIVVGYGNGTGVPAAYLFATIVLSIFAVGYTAMARHITATGAFYGFISHGLGQLWGLVSGLLATVAYIVFEASLIGIFASFAKTTVETFGGPELSWIVYALIGIAAIALLGYFDIEISGRVLAVFLITEIVILGLLSLSVLIRGGGPDGLMAQVLNPANAFTAVADDPAAAITGSAAIGLFFAFWSWVGFETTAVYGEESKDPKKIIPRATMMAVIGLGVFYTIVSWLAIAGNGAEQSVAISRGSTGNPFDLFFGITDSYVGGWALVIYKVLTVLGSFACALAFHNAASRYIYAIGREGLTPGLRRTLGATHGTHKSPHIASITQSVICLLITLAFFALQEPTESAPDVAYFYLYGLMAILGTAMILIVQTVCSIAVIFYFHVKGNHPETRHWWRTLVAPAIGAVGMGYVVYLLVDNLEFAAGAAADSPVFHAIPYIIGGVVLFGIVIGLILRSKDQERYQRIGRVVMEEDAPPRTSAEEPERA